jgi:hypothetical protein
VQVGRNDVAREFLVQTEAHPITPLAETRPRTARFRADSGNSFGAAGPEIEAPIPRRAGVARLRCRVRDASGLIIVLRSAVVLYGLLRRRPTCDSRTDASELPDGSCDSEGAILAVRAESLR